VVQRAVKRLSKAGLKRLQQGRPHTAAQQRQRWGHSALRL
jgi:hypothetical protein